MLIETLLARNLARITHTLGISETPNMLSRMIRLRNTV